MDAGRMPQRTEALVARDRREPPADPLRILQPVDMLYGAQPCRLPDVLGVGSGEPMPAAHRTDDSVVAFDQQPPGGRVAPAGGQDEGGIGERRGGHAPILGGRTSRIVVVSL